MIFERDVFYKSFFEVKMLFRWVTEVVSLWVELEGSLKENKQSLEETRAFKVHLFIIAVY